MVSGQYNAFLYLMPAHGDRPSFSDSVRLRDREVARPKDEACRSAAFERAESFLRLAALLGLEHQSYNGLCFTINECEFHACFGPIKTVMTILVPCQKAVI